VPPVRPLVVSTTPPPAELAAEIASGMATPVTARGSAAGEIEVDRAMRASVSALCVSGNDEGSDGLGVGFENTPLRLCLQEPLVARFVAEHAAYRASPLRLPLSPSAAAAAAAAPSVPWHA